MPLEKANSKRNPHAECTAGDKYGPIELWCKNIIHHHACHDSSDAGEGKYFEEQCAFIDRLLLWKAVSQKFSFNTKPFQNPEEIPFNILMLIA